MLADELNVIYQNKTDTEMFVDVCLTSDTRRRAALAAVSLQVLLVFVFNAGPLLSFRRYNSTLSVFTTSVRRSTRDSDTRLERQTLVEDTIVAASSIECRADIVV